jgi:carbon-monoxide dehydrogenase iron sulfur subunit
MTEHSKAKDPLKMYLMEKPRPLSKTKVEYRPPVSISIMCRHCAEAECVEACKNGTLTRNEKTGRIELNQDKCLGCWMCIMACPYGAISQFTRDDRAVANKCDLCPDREVPACVAVCPNRALVFEDRG